MQAVLQYVVLELITAVRFCVCAQTRDLKQSRSSPTPRTLSLPSETIPLAEKAPRRRELEVFDLGSKTHRLRFGLTC